MKEVNVKVLIPDDVDPQKVIDLSLMVRYQKENDTWRFVTMPFMLTDSAEDNTMEWHRYYRKNGDNDYCCSKCKFIIRRHNTFRYKYCPNCGRKAVSETMYESCLIDEVIVMFLKHIRPDGDISYFTHEEVERLGKIKELLERERR